MLFLFLLVCSFVFGYIMTNWGFPGGSVGKESACGVGDLGSISGLGRSPGKGNGVPLQDSCLGIPMDRGTLWATARGVTRVGHDLATKPPPLCLTGKKRREN